MPKSSNTGNTDDISSVLPILVAFTALIVIGTLWGASIFLTKMVVDHGYSFLGIIFWDMVIAIIVLGIALVWRKEKVSFSRSHLLFYIVIAFIGTILPNIFSLWATANLPAGIMAMLIATVPMISLMIALAIGNEKPDIMRIFGIVLGVSALMLLALPETSLPDPASWPFILIGLIAPVCYGIEGNFVAAKTPKDISPIAIIWSASLVGLALVTPLVWGNDSWINLFRPWNKFDLALIGVGLSHAIAYAGYIWLIGFAGIVFSTQVAYVVTITGFIFALIFLGETHSPYAWFAGMLMLIGLFLVQPRAHNSAD